MNDKNSGRRTIRPTLDLTALSSVESDTAVAAEEEEEELHDEEEADVFVELESVADSPDLFLFFDLLTLLEPVDQIPSVTGADVGAFLVEDRLTS